ncbi:G-protein coupled receptor Mth2 isoform X2 [Camponotus floridanus]|uniref:G-protein coupled receptor Mth2 isoform X2 n=1 Tax=Camponotus floridanus TaxID=104421 RepID=UPI000971638D|nr:G-protein coupled receptor Mth2 isoform X2 [Camponotus floridanus]
MCARSANFNSALFLAACGLLVAGSDDIANNESPMLKDPRSPTSEKNSNCNLHHDIPDSKVTYDCICKFRSCIRKCCHNDEVLRENFMEKPVCQKMRHNDTMSAEVKNKTSNLHLPKDQMAKEVQHVPQLKDYFRLLENSVCPVNFYPLNPDESRNVILQANGSLVDVNGTVYLPWNYCIDWQVTFDRISILICATENVPDNNIEDMLHHVCMAVSILLLAATFLVYAIIPELKNLYGKTLMCYVICLITAYVSMLLVNYISMAAKTPLCIITAFFIHFSFLASFFWLNVMCFDIWWTFGGFRSLQGSVKQREKKKFIIYSIYAWGSASILTIVCAIMDFVPNVPKEFIRPEFGEATCWFNTDGAKALYFYGPMSITVICNICLFISTALKILRHKKDTDHHLKGSESRRHDDNKQWFNLYLKLFIVMGINWSMEIVSWLFKNEPKYLWYLTDLTNTLQGLIIFIIFVCKKKVKRLLLKRFGFQDRDIFSRNSTRSVAYHSSASRTCTTSIASGVIPLQEKVNPYVQTNCRGKNSSDEADP